MLAVCFRIGQRDMFVRCQSIEAIILFLGLCVAFDAMCEPPFASDCIALFFFSATD